VSLAVGDCRVTLARWAAEGVRVQCVVTSPPYWGLRDYSTAPQVWDGDAACPHEWEEETRTLDNNNGKGDSSTAAAVAFNAESRYKRVVTGACLRCAAWRGSLGLEPTPEQYVAHLVEVFRRVREVLADDGTLWLNLGDSYNSSSQNNHGKGGAMEHAHLAPRDGWAGHRPMVPGLKPKDLVGIPWRVAFALQADGWWLRSDIIWAKPNPMPESVTDRPTKAHEYVFLLTKSERYFYDAASIREPDAGTDHPRSVLHRPEPTGGLMSPHAGIRKADGRNGDGRNRRSVWTIATQPYPEAHFATFPEDLVKPCILAGSRPDDTVLDPFMGSGTVAKVAQDLGRQWLGCELNPAYAGMCERRTLQQGLAL